MRYFLRQITQMPLSVALLLLIAALCMWVPDYVRAPELWPTTLLAQLLILLNGVLLCTTLYRAKAAPHFSLLPAVLYVLATAVFPLLRMHWQPQLPIVILLFFLYITRDMSDTHEPSGLVFFVTLLLCLAALLVPDALWCISFLWIVVLLQGTFTLRSILASLLAVALVGVYYVLAMYIGWADAWDYGQLLDRRWFGLDQPACIITAVAVMLSAFIVIGISAFQRSTYDLVSTRMLLYHVVLMGLLSSPLILLSASRQDCWALLPCALTATTGIYLMQKETESRGITLLIYIIGAIALYGVVLSTM